MQDSLNFPESLEVRLFFPRNLAKLRSVGVNTLPHHTMHAHVIVCKVYNSARLQRGEKGVTKPTGIFRKFRESCTLVSPKVKEFEPFTEGFGRFLALQRGWNFLRISGNGTLFGNA